MGVSKHGAPLDLEHGKWVPIFLNAVGEAQIRAKGYLCSRAASGEVACKACGKYLPSSVPLDAHLRGHLAELDVYLRGKQEERVEKTKQNLTKARAARSVNLVSIGAAIVVAGVRAKEEKAKEEKAKEEKALAELAVEYTPEELDLLEEFGV